jgi:hypothetical protein
MLARCPRCQSDLDVGEPGPTQCGVCQHEFVVAAPRPPDPDVLFSGDGIRVTREFLQAQGTSFAINKMASVTVSEVAPPNELGGGGTLLTVFGILLGIGGLLFGDGVTRLVLALLGIGMVAGGIWFIRLQANLQPTYKLTWLNNAGQAQSLEFNDLGVTRNVEAALLQAIAAH